MWQLEKHKVCQPAALGLPRHEPYSLKVCICGWCLWDGSVSLMLVCFLPVVCLRRGPKQICVFLIHCRSFIIPSLKPDVARKTAAIIRIVFDCCTRGSRSQIALRRRTTPVGSISVLGLLQPASSGPNPLSLYVAGLNFRLLSSLSSSPSSD